MRLRRLQTHLPTVDPSELSYNHNRLKMPFSWRVGIILQHFEKVTDSLTEPVGEYIVNVRRKLANLINPDKR